MAAIYNTTQVPSFNASSMAALANNTAVSPLVAMFDKYGQQQDKELERQRLLAAEDRANQQLLLQQQAGKLNQDKWAAAQQANELAKQQQANANDATIFGTTNTPLLQQYMASSSYESNPEWQNLATSLSKAQTPQEIQAIQARQAAIVENAATTPQARQASIAETLRGSGGLMQGVIDNITKSQTDKAMQGILNGSKVEDAVKNFPYASRSALLEAKQNMDNNALSNKLTNAQLSKIEEDKLSKQAKEEATLFNILNPLTTTQSVVETKDIYDPTKGQKIFNELEKTLTQPGSLDDKQKLEAYSEYLRTEHPEEYNAFTKKVNPALSALLNSSNIGVKGGVLGIKALSDLLLKNTSKEDRIKKELGSTAKNKAMSFYEFSQQKDQESVDMQKSVEGAKKAISDFIKTDKAGGAFTEKTTEVLKNVPVETIQTQIADNLAKLTESGASREKLATYASKANTLVDTLIASRQKQAENSQERADKYALANLKHLSQKELLSYKQELESKKPMTPKEAADVKLTMEKVRELLIKNNDSDSFF